MLEDKEYKENNLVCCKKNGDIINQVHIAGISKICETWSPAYSFHDLRHFNATMMLKYGVDVKIAAKRLGHSTPSTTQNIYQHVTKDMDMEAAKKLNKIIKK